MNQPTGVLNSISWKDLCPWLLLSRAIAIAIRPSIVFIAFVGICLTPIGWSVAQWVLADGETVGTQIPSDDQQKDYWIKIRTQIQTQTFWDDDFNSVYPPDGLGPLLVFSKFYSGHLEILNWQLNVRQCLYYFFGTVWMLLLWSVLGCMICRIAATHFTRDERIGVSESLSYAWRRLFSLWTSSFVPLFLISLFVIPFFFIGLVIRADFFLMLIGIGWFLVALLGLFMTVVLLPLFFGWPLVWPAIACESSDPFDAVSRSYSYPTQKPFHYVFYWVVILVFGCLAAWVASIIADKTIEFTKWGTSWGAGTERVEEINNKMNELHSAEGVQAKSSEPFVEGVLATPSDAALPAKEGSVTADDQAPQNSFTMLGAGANAIIFWEWCIRVVTIGFSYGFFFVAMTGMYLLLRKDNDFMELDEVYVEDDEDMIPLPEIEATGTTPESGSEKPPQKADKRGLAATEVDDEEPRLEED